MLRLDVTRGARKGASNGLVMGMDVLMKGYIVHGSDPFLGGRLGTSAHEKNKPDSDFLY